MSFTSDSLLFSLYACSLLTAYYRARCIHSVEIYSHAACMLDPATELVLMTELHGAGRYLSISENDFSSQ